MHDGRAGAVIHHPGQVGFAVAAAQGVGGAQLRAGVNDRVRVLNVAAVIEHNAVQVIGGLHGVGGCAGGGLVGGVHQPPAGGQVDLYEAAEVGIFGQGEGLGC